MVPSHPTSAIVLAGGMSRRLGQDKRRLRLWGTPGPLLLEHVVSVVGGLCPDVVVVLNDPEQWRQLPARLVPDRYPGTGPLGGLYSGLEAAQHEHALVVGCDMPFLNSDLLRALLAHPRNYDVLVPRTLRSHMVRNEQQLEPLHAIYRKTCCLPIEVTLAHGQREVVAFFAQVRVVVVEPEESYLYDPLGRSFLNINTPEQLALIKASLA